VKDGPAGRETDNRLAVYHTGDGDNGRWVVTIAAGQSAERMHTLTADSQHLFAQRCNAMYAVVKATEHDPPHFEKFDVLRWAYAEGVKELLFLDCDVFVKEAAPDIFEMGYGNALFSEIPHPRPSWLKQGIDWIRNNHCPNWPETRYFNTGVMLLNEDGLERVVHEIVALDYSSGPFFEQCLLNVHLHNAGLPDTSLPAKWNQFCGYRWLTKRKEEEAFFLHACALDPATRYNDFRQIITRQNP